MLGLVRVLFEEEVRVFVESRSVVVVLDLDVVLVVEWVLPAWVVFDSQVFFPQV